MLNVEIGKGLRINVDLAKIEPHANVMDRVIYMGLRNILMDSHASIKKDDPDCATKAMAIATKKLEAMYEGIMRISPESSSDPVEREARRMCVTQVNKTYKEAGRKLSSVTTDEMAQMVDANWEAFIPLAQEYVDKMKAAPTIELKLPMKVGA